MEPGISTSANKGRAKWIGALVIATALVVVAVSYGIKGNVLSDRGATIEARGEDAFRPGNQSALATVEGGTREKIRTSVLVSDANMAARTARPSEVAVPFAMQKVGEVTLRKFALFGERGSLSPSLVAVNELDIVEFAFTASDRDYAVRFPDFGVYRAVKRGETATFQFQAYPFGEYVFTCAEGCSAGTGGKLVVNPK